MCGGGGGGGGEEGGGEVLTSTHNLSFEQKSK